MSASTSIRQPESAADHAAIRGLCRAYRACLVNRSKRVPQIVESVYPQDTYETLLIQLPQQHARPTGALFLAESAGQPVGCGMTHALEPGLCEIKRLFVAPAARRNGVARKLVRSAMAQARADGHRRMVLDTMAWLEDAIALYTRLGFAPCPPFHTPPPEFAHHIRFFARSL